MSFQGLERSGLVNLSRSSLIGTGVGILPGVGASIGSIVAYTDRQEYVEDAGAIRPPARQKVS